MFYNLLQNSFSAFSSYSTYVKARLMTVWSMSVHQCGFSVLCVGVFDIPGDLPILPEGDGDTEAGQQQVGHHTDDRQRCHGDENQQ